MMPFECEKVPDWVLREYRRHLQNLKWALDEAAKHLERGSRRQAYGKVFLAWKEAIALTIASLLATPSLSDDAKKALLEALGKLPSPPLEDERITVTTSNAPKVLRTLITLCGKLGCSSHVTRVLGLLEESRSLAYMLHVAFYEGAEHAGFVDDEEASSHARELVRKLALLLGNYML